MTTGIELVATTLNVHRVLAGSSTKDGFLARLQVPDAQREKLATARDLIRQAIRAGCANWASIVDVGSLLPTPSLRRQLPHLVLRPKFRMQGSATYHTLNDPAHKPPQQIDYDDGVYLPTSVMQNGRTPLISSQGFFLLIEAILQPLCDSKGWKLGQKPSCVRVGLDDKAHIDLPLYAIPDTQYGTLVESFSTHARDSAVFADSVDLLEGVYRELKQDEIQLAHREKGWIDSDPRAIEKWFLGAVEIHGEQLRRVCRYLKAWRDFSWKADCTLSSITLMACAVDTYDSFVGRPDPQRDDIALLEVARTLPGRFEGDIRNPANGQVLNDKWSDADRRKYKMAAEELVQRIQHAIRGTDSPAAAISELTAALGPRIPTDVSLVPIATAEMTVRRYEPTRMPAPVVPRTTSG